MTWETSWQLVGWLLFIICAICYTLDNIQAGNPLGTAGSVIFLVACFAFLIPLVWKREEEGTASSAESAGRRDDDRRQSDALRH